MDFSLPIIYFKYKHKKYGIIYTNFKSLSASWCYINKIIYIAIDKNRKNRSLHKILKLGTKWGHI